MRAFNLGDFKSPQPRHLAEKGRGASAVTIQVLVHTVPWSTVLDRYCGWTSQLTSMTTGRQWTEKKPAKQSSECWRRLPKRNPWERCA